MKENEKNDSECVDGVLCTDGSFEPGISLPPMIAFPGPPDVVVIPGTYVYVVPDAQEDIFFYHGFWWRPWRGNWYRSANYSKGWVYYKNPLYDLKRTPSNWRDDYRNRRWKGQEWRYARIHQQDV